MKTQPLRSPILAAAALALAVTASAASAQTPGEALYARNCAACHQPSGKGVPGAFPALAADPIALGPTDRLASLLLRGRGGMPSFRDDLNNEQIAAVLTYVRGAWGNHATQVAPATIKAMRGANAPAPSLQAIQAH